MHPLTARSPIGSLLLWFGLINAASAIVTSGDPDDHRVVAGETSYGLTLDGVALIGFGEPGGQTIAAIDTPGCTGALISDRFVLTAAHCFDGDLDGTVDEWFTSWPVLAGFELADGTELAQIDTARIHFPAKWPDDWSSDIAVVELLQAVSTDVPRYRIYAGNGEVGRQVVLAGYGLSGRGMEGVDPNQQWTPLKRAGMNRVELIEASFLVYDFDSGLPANNALAQLGVDSDLGVGEDEAMMSWGDSGGPVFLDSAIAAVAALGERFSPPDATESLDSSWGEVAYNVRLADFVDFLITATGNSARFVELPGDLNDNGQRDGGDLDLIGAAIRGNTFDPRFDFDASGALDFDDQLNWIHHLAQTYVGDGNLDGRFNSQDLVVAFQSGQYQDAVIGNSTWATGDWDGDGDFTASDLVAAFQDGGYEKRDRVIVAVPEPFNVVWIVACMTTLTRRRLRR